MKTLSQKIGLLIAVAVSPWMLPASTITAQVTGLDSYGTVEMQMGADTRWQSFIAGAVVLSRTGGTAELELLPDASNFIAFCLEPRESISLNSTYTWEVGDLTDAPTSLKGMSPEQANQIRTVIALAYPTFGDSLTPLMAVAIQVALWEIVEETSGTWDVTSGSIRFRNPSEAGALKMAQSLLDTIDQKGPYPDNLFALTLSGNQDLLIQIARTAENTSHAPEPATLSMLGLGLLALGVTKRKRK